MSQHIAIVEDEPSIRENYADVFKQQDMRFHCMQVEKKLLMHLIAGFQIWLY